MRADDGRLIDVREIGFNISEIGQDLTVLRQELDGVEGPERAVEVREHRGRAGHDHLGTLPRGLATSLAS